MKKLLRHMNWLVIFVASSACAAGEDGAATPSYGVQHIAKFDLASRTARVTLVVEQQDGVVKHFNFNAPTDFYSRFSGDGVIQRQGERLHWHPPADGGVLRFEVVVDRQRTDDTFDARFTQTWALLRLGDIFPAAAVKTRVGARPRSQLELKGPQGWSVLSRYTTADLPAEPERRYTRPNGWAIAGDIGVRRETIAGRSIVFAGPKNEGVRRLDMLTFLRFTLPALVERVPLLPEHLLIVSASQDMWRGALSGPGSLYIHADRPLVSGNGTSTLLHELVHVGGRHKGDDWLVEGFAEYFGVAALRDSGGLSEQRYAKVPSDLREWAQREQAVLTSPSKGAGTACAVIVLESLDRSLPGGITKWLNQQSGQLSGDALRSYAKRLDVPFPSCR